MSAAQIQRRRTKNAAAAKARKTRIRAIVLVCIFAIVVVIQGPRTLRMISGGDATTASAPAAGAEASGDRTPQKVSRALMSLRRNPAADPFAKRSITDGDSPAGSVAAPSGLHDPFAPRGATAQPASAPQAPPTLVVGTPTPNRVAKISFIVVLASIPTSMGQSTATRFARQARASGIGSIGVVDSSTRKPLRPGYYAVYYGSFYTLRAVNAAVARAHRYGFAGAYPRQLVRY